MIKYIKGDLIKMALNGEFDIIIHGANCFTTMGAGIAKQISEVFPNAYLADCNTIYRNIGNIEKLGNYSKWQYECPNLMVVNAYTQYRPGPNAEYSALINFLILFENDHILKNKRIGVPWIGCGIGGLDINKVKEIFELYWKHLDVTMVEFG